jgi:hypothetical protein
MKDEHLLRLPYNILSLFLFIPLNKMNKNLHMIYMVVSPIIIVVLLVLTILYWKQKKDCEKKECVKESMCLCNGPQIQTECKPYNLFSKLGLDVNSPKSKGPSELKMRYDQRWTGQPPNFTMPYANGAC